MIRYLIDANCFIQAKNLWYGFDFCPGYWQWLDQQNVAGSIFSIDHIRTELIQGNDDLASWAAAKGEEFFLPIDQSSILLYGQVIRWSQMADFTPSAKSVFSSVADPWLVAHAKAPGFTVVSHEKLEINRKNAIKLPRACQQFGVDYCDVFDMLRNTGVKLVL